VVLLAASFVSSCGGALPRETTATNARVDDAWLESGPRCAGSSEDDAGLRIEEIEAGSGAPFGDGQEVRVHYVARLPDGKIVHDTRQGGEAPIELVIGSTRVICGFEKGLLGMRAGGQRRVTVPWRLGFGEAGRPPDVPPRTDVAFVIDLFRPAVSASQNGLPPSNPTRGGGGRGR
jgi:FKBP-type peptidyl-prolyl cis-trans isomerase FkpA